MRNFLFAILVAAAVPVSASTVQVTPGLPSVWLKAWQLGGFWQPAALAAEDRPAALSLDSGLALAQLHLGTNTDVFGVYQIGVPNSILNPQSYWLRYTLDSSSYSYSNWNGYETSPVSGELWVSFLPEANGYRIGIHSDNVIGAGVAVRDVTTWSLSGQTNVQTIHGFDYPDTCTLGDCGGASLNLSFLAFYGSDQYGYDLYTTATGFDEVFSASAYADSYGVVYRIAPVPLPASAVLLMSALTGVMGMRRFGKASAI